LLAVAQGGVENDDAISLRLCWHGHGEVLWFCARPQIRKALGRAWVPCGSVWLPAIP
jgi:hypothetical protein